MLKVDRLGEQQQELVGQDCRRAPPSKEKHLAPVFQTEFNSIEFSKENKGRKESTGKVRPVPELICSLHFTSA